MKNEKKNKKKQTEKTNRREEDNLTEYYLFLPNSISKNILKELTTE